jgi:hypothetical protein
MPIKKDKEAPLEASYILFASVFLNRIMVHKSFYVCPILLGVSETARQLAFRLGMHSVLR